MDELDAAKIFNKIIFKELEPCVLNEEIIKMKVYDQGPSGGEAGRLFRAMEIQYEKVTVLRLEFLNILQIDHLWILPNLQVLSLAFNKIDKIENFDALKNLKELNLTYNNIEKMENFKGLENLEILSVFGNQIKKIENVDCLESLIIFSAGNNLIDTKDGIERLRFLKNLRSLNLKGNEVEKNDKFFRLYIAGLLPDLTYYEYKHISKEEREEGKDRFRFKLREIMDNEKAEVQDRERMAKEREDNAHLTNCFVEYLDKHQLFDVLFCFDNDEQGKCLLAIGNEAQILISEFREQSFAITQKIHRIGLEEFKKRKIEHETFMNCVTVGRKKIQVQGQKTIDDFLEKIEAIFKQIRWAINEVEEKLKQNPEYEEATVAAKNINDDKVTKLTDEFNSLFEETWKSLMENEMHLHESIIETNSTFELVIQDMMNEFMEQCKTQFVQLREVENNFIDALIEAVQSFVTLKAATGHEDEIPEELREGLINRDIIHNHAAGMRDMHMQKIDGREDQLITRGKKWVQELCDELQQNETNRNRNKVMEINYFLDTQSGKLEDITSKSELNISIL